MTICRKCGTSNPDDRKFCTFCHELLVADPEELAKMEAARQKKLQKALKKLKAKHKRWKRALLMLIPILLFDLFDLLLCADLALIGIGASLGSELGAIAESFVGRVIEVFGARIFTSIAVEYIIRGLELLGALGMFAAATVCVIVMIVRMIKWRKYRTKGDPKEQELLKQMKAPVQDQSEQFEAAVQDEQSEQELNQALSDSLVSYQSLQELCENREQYAMPAPTAVMDCKSLYDALIPCLWEYDASSVRRIVSAMCSSRMLLCSAGALDSASIFENLARAFAVQAKQLDGACAEDDPNAASSARILLQRDPETGVLTHTSFVHGLYTATFAPKNVCFSGVSGIGAKDCESVFAPMAPYFKLPSDKAAMYIGKPAEGVEDFESVSQGKMLLPSNVWVLNVLPEQDHALSVGEKFGQYCAAIYLRNSQNVYPPEGAESALAVLPSIDALERAIESAEGRNYLTEDMWKVVDTIEQQVLELGGAHLSNRTLRMLERYTSVYMECGGKLTEAFDNGFAAILLPAYGEQLAMLANRAQGEKLSEILERTVGCDRLPVTVAVLTAMNLM